MHVRALRWDPHYVSYLQRAGFLELAQTVVSSLPDLDTALLTAAIDRWWPETHMFHLSCGEMTIML